MTVSRHGYANLTEHQIHEIRHWPQQILSLTKQKYAVQS